jgi:hypothetical protein
MELDPDDADDQDEHQDDNWDDEHEPSGKCESDWDTLAFEQQKSFPRCTTPFCKERNIAHTHSTDRCYKLHPSKGKGRSSKGSSSSLFTKGGKVAAKERTRVITRVRGRRAKTLVVVPSTTPVTSARSHDITKRSARSMPLSFQKPVWAHLC